MNLNELKASGLLAQLIIAIEGNKVAEVEELVNQLNELDVLSADFPYATFLNPNKITNTAAIYAAANLTNP